MTTAKKIDDCVMNVLRHQFNEYDGGLLFDEISRIVEFTLDLRAGSFDESGSIERLLSSEVIELYHEEGESELRYRLV